MNWKVMHFIGLTSKIETLLLKSILRACIMEGRPMIIFVSPLLHYWGCTKESS
jgi:hypothetical protein